MAATTNPVVHNNPLRPGVGWALSLKVEGAFEDGDILIATLRRSFSGSETHEVMRAPVPADGLLTISVTGATNAEWKPGVYILELGYQRGTAAGVFFSKIQIAAEDTNVDVGAAVDPLLAPGGAPIQLLVDVPTAPAITVTLEAGLPGPKGAAILSGDHAPLPEDGKDGDFWIDTSASPKMQYGPKAGGAWPAEGWSVQIDPADVVAVEAARVDATAKAAAAEASRAAAVTAQTGANTAKADAAASAASLAFRVFQTKALAASTVVPGTISAFQTQGLSAPGDDGGGLYKRVASQPAHNGKIQTADGAWWELTGKQVSILAFGALSANDTPLFQAAADWSRLTGNSVIVPPVAGGYTWTAMLDLQGGEQLYGFGWPVIRWTINALALTIRGENIACKGLKFTTPQGGTVYQIDVQAPARYCDIDLWIATGNSGMVVHGSYNQIRFKGQEMRGSGFKLEGLDCHHNTVHRVDLRNVALGGLLLEDGAHHNKIIHGSKYTDPVYYTTYLATGLGSQQANANAGYLGGDIFALTFGCNDNYAGLLESSGNRDGCCTLNGERNHVVTVDFENTMSGGVNITGAGNRVDGGRIVNVKSAIRFASSFGGIAQRNVVGPIVIQDCKEYGVIAEGNSIRFWLPNQLYTDDPDYVAYDNGLTINIYKAQVAGVTATTGSVPPTHLTGTVSDATAGEASPTPVAVTFGIAPNTVIWTSHGLAVGRPVTFQTTGVLPGPLVAGNLYYVKSVVDADTFTIASTQGGSTLDLTGTPTSCTATAPRGTTWLWLNGRPSSEGIAATANKLIGVEARRNAAGDYTDTTVLGGYEMIGCFDTNGPLQMSKPWTMKASPDPVYLKAIGASAAAVVLTLDGNAVRYACGTAGGTSTAYTATSTPTLGTLEIEPMISIDPGVASGASPTLSVNGQTALPLLFADGTPFAAGELTVGIKRFVRRTGLGFGGARDGWYLWSSLSPPKNVPSLDTNNISYAMTGTVTAVEKATNTRKTWDISANVKRGANIASTALSAAVKTVRSADTAAATWDITLAIDATNAPLHGNLAIQGVGEAGKTIEWKARLMIE
jgi:hypothetical protein